MKLFQVVSVPLEPVGKTMSAISRNFVFIHLLFIGAGNNVHLVITETSSRSLVRKKGNQKCEIKEKAH